MWDKRPHRRHVLLAQPDGAAVLGAVRRTSTGVTSLLLSTQSCGGWSPPGCKRRGWDSQRDEIVVHDEAGRKGRVTMLPGRLVDWRCCHPRRGAGAVPACRGCRRRGREAIGLDGGGGGAGTVEAMGRSGCRGTSRAAEGTGVPVEGRSGGRCAIGSRGDPAQHGMRTRGDPAGHGIGDRRPPNAMLGRRRAMNQETTMGGFDSGEPSHTWKPSNDQGNLA